MPRTCLLSAMKNEGPDVLEWAAYHHLIGFDDILVYTNDCSDGSDTLLEAIATLGWLTHHRHTAPAPLSPQDNVALLAPQTPQMAKADWAMWLDGDEFLVIHPGAGQMADLISTTRGAHAMALNWRCFGDNGHDHSDQSLVTARFTRGMSLENTQSRSVKTLFRTGPHIAQLGIHRPIFTEGADITLRDGAGKPLGPAFQFGRNKDGAARHRLPEGRQSWRIAQVNHYPIKALDRLALKQRRGRGISPDGVADRFNPLYLALFNHNDIEDTAIARHLPALRALIAEMLQTPAIATAYAACQQADATRRAEVADLTARFAAVRGQSIAQAKGKD